MMQTAPEVKFWRALAEALQKDANLVAALHKTRAAVTGTPMAGIAAGLLSHVEAGRKLCEAMQAVRQAQLSSEPMGPEPTANDLLPPQVLAAVEAAEQTDSLPAVAARIAEALRSNQLDALVVDAPTPTPEAAAARRAFDQIVADAVKARATDIHIEPLEGGRVRIRRRIDGVLHEAAVLPPGLAMPLADRIKAMASMDVTQRREPQDGRIDMRVEGSRIDLRLNVLPTLYGERITIRLLSRDAIPLSLDTLGLTAENIQVIRQLVGMPQGLILVSGPTGSGKTTLLYAMLVAINLDNQMVVTIEDPVEFSFEKISQIQVLPQTGLTFARALRNILRQDPDVIMVGEIRDFDVLMACVQASLTGHLVLSTLHTSTAVETIRRVLDIGLQPFLVNSCLQAVITQRLARLLCPDCKQPIAPDRERLPAEARRIVDRFKDTTWYGPKGCAACGKTGYRGRTALHEILRMNDRVRQVVSANGTMGEIHAAAIESGMKTMLEDGLTRAAQGMTSIDEVLRIVPQGSHP